MNSDGMVLVIIMLLCLVGLAVDNLKIAGLFLLGGLVLLAALYYGPLLLAMISLSTLLTALLSFALGGLLTFLLVKRMA